MHLLHFRRTVAAAALTVLLAAPGVAAQEDRPSEFDSYLVPGWSFTPGIRFSGMWDSNVALRGRQPAGETTAGDNLWQIVPSADLQLTGTRTQFNAGYRGYLRRYTEIDELNGYDQRAYASVNHAQTARLTLFAQNEFSEMPTTDLVELNGLPFLRVGTRSNRMAAGFDYRVTKYTDVKVRYENTWTAFDSLEGGLRGGVLHGMRADVGRRLSERLTIGAEGRVRRSGVEAIDDPRVLWFHDGGGTIAYRLTPSVTVAAAAGFSHLRDSRFEETRTAPFYRLSADRDLRRGTVGLVFERAYTPSFGFSGSDDTRELRGFVRVPFSRNRFYVQANGIWRHTIPFFAEDLELDTFVTDTTFGYSTTRWLRMEAVHAFSRQDSVITGGEVDRHRFGVQLVISQPMRIR